MSSKVSRHASKSSSQAPTADQKTTGPTSTDTTTTNGSSSSSISQAITLATPDAARRSAILASLEPLLLLLPPPPPPSSSLSTAPGGSSGRRWRPTADGTGIERTVRFRTFKQATAFMTAMFARIAAVRHHPTLTNTYNAVGLTWSTHRDRQSGCTGVSELDVRMARESDEVAAECGEVVAVEQSESNGDGGGGKKEK